MRYGLFLVTGAAACRPITTTDVGNLEPGVINDQAEVSSTSLFGQQAQALCGNPTGVAEVFVAGEANQIGVTTTAGVGTYFYRARVDQLGTPSYTSVNLPQQYGFLSGSCCGGSGQPACPRLYAEFSDQGIARYPDGRLFVSTLAVKNICDSTGALATKQGFLITRISRDCGANWTESVLDPEVLTPSVTVSFLDRQNVYVDREQNRILQSARVDSSLGSGWTWIWLAFANDTDDAPNWLTVLAGDLGLNGAPLAMTSFEDDREDIWLFGCAGSDPTLWRARFPFELTKFSLGALGAPPCRIVSPIDLQGTVLSESISNVFPGVDVIPLRSGGLLPTGTNLRVVYSDRTTVGTTAFQIARVRDVNINGERATVLSEGIGAGLDLDYSAQNEHVLWPDLVGHDGFTSVANLPDAHVLHYVTVRTSLSTSGFVRMRVQAHTWSVGWVGPRQVAAFFADTQQMRPRGDGTRFMGDYKYGTFVQDLVDPAGREFFVPYTHPVTAVGQVNSNVFGVLVDF
jgi:hypothetical protein